MINNVYKIQIDDITIRCYEKSDVLKLKEAIDCSLEHLYDFMEWSHDEPEPLAEKEKRILSWRKDFLDNIDYVYAVFRGEKLIASTGLHTNAENEFLEIGYWVRADEINKGVATKISCALIITAFKKLGVESVNINYEIANIASSKIPKKLKLKQGKNYFHETRGENCTWIIDKQLFKANKTFYTKFYHSISFFDINGKNI